MFDIGWTELMVIGIVALIVVGPKDLPGMFRALGKFTAKARRMARDFQRAMEEAADESGIREAAADLKGMTNPRKMGLDALNEAAEKFEKWEPGKAKTPGPAKTAGKPAEKAAAKPATPEAAAAPAAAAEAADAKGAAAGAPASGTAEGKETGAP